MLKYSSSSAWLYCDEMSAMNRFDTANPGVSRCGFGAHTIRIRNEKTEWRQMLLAKPEVSGFDPNPWFEVSVHLKRVSVIGFGVSGCLF